MSVQLGLSILAFSLSNKPFSYLDDLPRVASDRYIPTNGKGQRKSYFCVELTCLRSEDILRARLKTVGVTELRVDMNKSELLNKFGPGSTLSTGWHIYDVGGHRSMVRTSSLLLGLRCFLPVALSGSEVRTQMEFQNGFLFDSDVHYS